MKLLGLGETLPLCSSAAASRTLASLALTDNVPEVALVGYPQTTRLPWGQRPGGIPSTAKQRQATPASGVPSPHVPQPSCASTRAHTHTHTRVPRSAAPSCRSAARRSPQPEVRLFAQVPTTSGQFSGRLILLVSARSAFNHGSTSDGMVSFPSGFGHTAWGRSLAEPSSHEKYLAALRGASRPPWPAPGSAAAPRPGSSERGGAGRSGQKPSRNCLEPPALLGAALQRKIWQGRERKAAGSARAHTPHSRSAAANPVGVGWGEILCPAPTAEWPRLRELACEGSVASGIRAASGPEAPGRSRSFPGSLARPGEPAWLASLCLPSPVLGCPCPIPDARWAPVSRQRPQSRAIRAALSPARPVREGGGRAQRQVGRTLRANFGVPLPSASPSPGSSTMGTTSGGHKCTLETPEQSRLSRPPSALPCCGAPAAAAGAVPEGRAAAGAGSLASGACRVARPGCRSPPG